MVGHESHGVLLVFQPDLNPPQPHRIRRFFVAGQEDDFVVQDIGSIHRRPCLGDDVAGVVLQPADEVDAGRV